MANRVSLIAGFAFVTAAAVAAAGPARAQCRLCDQPTTTAAALDGSADVTLSVEASLDFDRVVLTGSNGGTATLLPNGERSASGGIAAISGRAMVGAVFIRGEAGRAVRVELPRSLQLFSLSGGQIAIHDIASDLPSLPKLDSAGNLSFRFGGRLTVTGDAEGDYRGDVPITVEYL